jgi:Fanconi-associated nuclease 1
LNWYLTNGGWRGWHCEGTPLFSLFALLMWDVLFCSPPGEPAEVRGVFLSPYQDAPLDLDSGGNLFYRRREGAIRETLAAIAAASAQELSVMLEVSWRAHFGQVCRGMHWDSAPLGLLQLLAVGLGAGTLAALCNALAFNYRALHSGLPDLVLWRVEDAGGMGAASSGSSSCPSGIQGCGTGGTLPSGQRVRVRLVEVKGPTDHIRDGQLAWIHILAEAGVDFAVCKVCAPKE